MPSDGESCELRQHHSDEEDQDNDNGEELDDRDSTFEGVRNRLRVYKLHGVQH